MERTPFLGSPLSAQRRRARLDRPWTASPGLVVVADAELRRLALDTRQGRAATPGRRGCRADGGVAPQLAAVSARSPHIQHWPDRRSHAGVRLLLVLRGRELQTVGGARIRGKEQPAASRASCRPLLRFVRTSSGLDVAAPEAVGRRRTDRAATPVAGAYLVSSTCRTVLGGRPVSSMTASLIGALYPSRAPLPKVATRSATGCGMPACSTSPAA